MSAKAYLADMVDVFLPALQDADRVTILTAPATGLPWATIEHPAVNYVTATASPYSWSGKREIATLIQWEHPDVWWCADTTLPPPIKVRRAPSPKIVYAIEDMRYLFETYKRRRGWKRWTRFFVKRRLRKADALVCPSDAVATHTMRVLGLTERQNVYVIHNGVHPIFRLHRDDEILKMRRHLRIPKRYVLVVSSVRTAHYVEPILRAMGTNVEVASVTCVILGEATLPAMLRETIRDCHMEGMVRFVDQKDVNATLLPALFSGALVYFEPSQDVAYLPTILQAMACGTPVVCAASEANAALFGKAVLRVHPTAPKEWRQALSAFTLSTTLHARQVKRGLDFASAATATAMAKRSFALARKLCETSGNDGHHEEREETL